MTRSTPLRIILLGVALAGSVAAQIQTHGDAVGDPGPDSVLVWTRASADAQVSVLVATSPAMAGAVETAAVAATATRDFTAKVPVTGLQPSTQYWFQTKLADPNNPGQFTLGPVGSFRTAPPAATSPPVDFLVSCDIRVPSQFDLFAPMLAHNPDFFVCLGDFPYNDGAVTRSDFWGKYQMVRSDTRVQAFLRDVPLVAVWDDHEIVDNWDASTDPTLVAEGIAAFFDYLPVADGPEIYRSMRWGDTVEVFMLDTRSHRGVNDDPDTAAKSMLGATQLAWLEQGLSASTATFKIVASTVPLRYSKTSLDSWLGYQHERAKLFDHIAANHIENVLFFSGDAHFPAFHQHREGVVELQTGPVAQLTPLGFGYGEPEVRWRLADRSYTRIRIDPAAQPPTLAVEWYGPSGLQHTEVLQAHTPATLSVEADEPEAAWAAVDGPHYYRESGPRHDLPRVVPGSYRFVFEDLPDAPGRPVDLPVTVPPGGDVRVAGNWYDVPRPEPVLFADAFTAPLSGWTVTDDGTTAGPSSWFTDNGSLFQSSSIGGSGATYEEPGTVAVAGDPAWTDYSVSCRWQGMDVGAVGLVLRHADDDNYYRVSFDQSLGVRRLVSKKAGAFRLLAEVAEGYYREKWYGLRAVVSGSRIRVWVDGRLLFDVTDGDHPAGAAGLYTAHNPVAAFDDFVVRGGDTSTAGRAQLLADDFDDGVFGSYTVLDEGTFNAPSFWIEGNGVFSQLSNINDGTQGSPSIPKLGTMALASGVFADHDLIVKIRNDDDDAIGVVFRYTDPSNYYRFSMDAQRAYRRLTKVENGVWSTLWEDQTIYEVATWHLLHVRAVGPEISVSMNGRRILDVVDASHAQGQVGLYCWESSLAKFDDLLVQDAAVDRPSMAAVWDGSSTTRFDARAPASAGEPYFIALSGARTPGIPLRKANPNDPRIMDLAGDGIFFATLVPSPLFVGFQGIVPTGGAIAAQITWPPLPGLAGVVLYAGGFTVALSGGKQVVDEIIPTVEAIIR